MSVLILFRQFGVSHEAEGSCAIFDAHHDNAAHSKVLPQVTAIPLSLEAATMNPYEYRQTVVDRGGGGRDAEVETVFAHHVGSTTRACGLWGQGTELIGLAHAFPRLGRLGRAPTQVAYWRCCVRNSFINCKLSIENTLDVACLYMGLQKRLLLGTDHRYQGEKHEKGRK